MSGLMTSDELRNIRGNIKNIDKEILKLEKMVKEVEERSVFFYQTLPYKFQLGVIKKQRETLAKKINYII